MRPSYAAVSATLFASTLQALPTESTWNALGRSTSTSSAYSNTTKNACAQIASLHDGHDPKSGHLWFEGKLAYECLNSMPFESDKAVTFAQALRKLLNFHSTLDILKSPPKSYGGEAIDLAAEMDQIIKNANANRYSSHYTFERSMVDLWTRSRDFHVILGGLCSTASFQFSRGVELVSISRNGIDAPQVYAVGDASLLWKDAQAKVTPIVKINGQRPESFLEGLSNTRPYDDADSRYNRMFTSTPMLVGKQGLGAFNASEIWPGVETTEIEWSNGTYKRFPTLARATTPKGTFGFASGQDLYDATCVLQQDEDSDILEQMQQNAPKPKEQPLPPVYPAPIFKTKSNIFAGFYPKSLPDTAIISLPSFNQKDIPLALEFERIALEFVSQAAKDNKQRLIIDLSANGGGQTSLAYALYTTLFPGPAPFVASTFRAHPGAQALAQLAEAVSAKTGPEPGTGGNPFTRLGAAKPDQSASFLSLAEFYGPQLLLNSNFSAFYAPDFNLADPPIVGWGTARGQELDAPPFKPENILLVTDGTCGSACSIFVELMRHEKGVRTLALGGRSSPGPMIAVGGSKGTQTLPYKHLSDITEAIRDPKLSARNATSVDDHDLLDRLKKYLPPPLAALPYVLDAESGVNYQNSYRSTGDPVPVQFMQEPANCRLYYTAAMWFKPEAVWQAVYDAWWGTGICIPGST